MHSIHTRTLPAHVVINVHSTYHYTNVCLGYIPVLFRARIPGTRWIVLPILDTLQRIIFELVSIQPHL